MSKNFDSPIEIRFCGFTPDHTPTAIPAELIDRECVICGYRWYENHSGPNCPQCADRAAIPAQEAEQAPVNPIDVPCGACDAPAKKIS